MTNGSQVLSLRMTPALQRDEDLRVALRAVNPFSLKSPELADGGGRKTNGPVMAFIDLGRDITSACISTPYQFEDANDGKASTSAPLLPLPIEHHGRPRTPATLVTSYWHKRFPSSTNTTLKPDVVAIHQAVDRMGSQLKLYSHLQVEEDQSEPVGVNVPAHPEVARKASIDEFVAWYGPVWLSLSTHSRQLIPERDVNIGTLEYLRHEREWQLYENKT
ncbi:hypothetical protein CGLO_06911 [Colletotrichum gloeosporioides Cg-14]|uniref:Uncharacterized protein n=1 Tax=Colletotrichum gloeosporioides (strain Cg-14) TaxID=1237896 RepID=T0KD62_COLGC|nr:hypothetical protein CGLO_06911 [Colletotrichum gloeosporioides Cg-14]